MTSQQYLAIVRAAHQLDMLRMQYLLMLAQAGLDPAQSYRYDDATLTITPIEPEVPDQG